MALIKEITAREILNAKGYPTIESRVLLDDGVVASASVACSAEVNRYEAVTITDHDPVRFSGRGVLKTVDTVKNILAQKLVGMDAANQQEIDKTMVEMDGTDNKSKLGANAIVSVSMAVAKAAAASAGMPLFLYLRRFVDAANVSPKIPTLLITVMNGGRRGMGAIDFEELLIVPASSKTLEESLQIGFHVSASLQNILKLNGFSVLTGSEGGFSPNVAANYDALSLLSQAAENTTYRLGYDVFFGINAAAAAFLKNDKYSIKDKKSPLSASELIKFYQQLVKDFHLLYLEDALDNDDWDTWSQACTSLSADVTLVGDGLTSTNLSRLQIALEKKAISGMVIVPAQIGTVIEALAIVQVAKAAGLKIIVSHRTDDTTEDFVADFAVAAGADYVKFGAMDRGEHVVKYNRLLAIDAKLRMP